MEEPNKILWPKTSEVLTPKQYLKLVADEKQIENIKRIDFMPPDGTHFGKFHITYRDPIFGD